MLSYPFPSPASSLTVRLGPKNCANGKETRVPPPVRGPTRERACAGAARAVRTARHCQGLVHRIFGAGPSAQIVRFASLNISPGVACWCLIGSASSSHERRARDMDLPTGPGLFIDDNDWFRPARTSPFRPAGKSCGRRHSRGYSRSAEQQSHITRALCTGSARGRVRTCIWRSQIRDAQAGEAISSLCFTDHCQTLMTGTGSLPGRYLPKITEN